MQAELDFIPRTRVLFGAGKFRELGRLAKELGFRRTLLVADAGVRAAGYVDAATKQLEAEGVHVFPFHDFDANPDTKMVEAGRAIARPHHVDSIIGNIGLVALPQPQ